MNRLKFRIVLLAICLVSVIAAKLMLDKVVGDAKDEIIAPKITVGSTQEGGVTVETK